MAKADITKWSVLSKLNEEFVSKIKSFFVFGANGSEVIIILNNDNVYAFGGNSNGCLGLGHKNNASEPTKIEELSNKVVINIEFGGEYDFALLLTRNNEVFSWGSNNFGQLGVGNQTTILSPVLLKDLIGKNVTDIKCGVRHCLALTKAGEVYYWGYVSKNLNELKPRLMLNINEYNIISISCGFYHTLALTYNGQVYSWGDNKLQTDSNGKEIFQEYPSHIKFEHVLYQPTFKITRINCGPNHSLMLSSTGDVYAFGDNSYAQCGQDRKWTMKKISSYSDRLRIKDIIDIAATKSFNISIALLKNGGCFIWGVCGNQIFDSPTKIRMNKIIDVLEYCSKVKVTFDRCYYENKIKYHCENDTLNKFKEKFNSKNYSDIAFKIENQYIYAQKLYLKIVCPHFDVMFSSDNWVECKENEIAITQYSYDVYYAFIGYLYTNEININPENVIELLDLANSYFEDELKQRCVQIIKTTVSMENVFRMYANAIQYKSEELRVHCVDYFYDNMKDKSILENHMEKCSNL